MRHQPSSAKLFVVLALLIAAVASGCGDDSGNDDVPADAVARVGDTIVTKHQARTFVPEAAKVPAVRKKASEYLIVAEWIRRDAKRQRVSVPASVVTSALSRAEAKTPNTVAQIKVPLLMRALTEKAAGTAASAEQIARYYREHPNEYARPEVRYIRSVATDSRAEAVAARRALEQGQSWKAVIARYGTDKESVPIPSGDMGAQPGEFPDSIGDAIYAADRGTFNGPVNAEGAWYVFELMVIDRLPAQTLTEVREHIGSRLEAKGNEIALDALQRRMRARYRPITVCNEDLLLPQCKNGPPLRLDSNAGFGLSG